ncbi:hypothetical protein [Streptomyces sp. NPDC059651]|uniref:hypothetical protein n=1 Tax=Streptomyces sp. NPDC059651 TaxID=3346897 RepID=UPI0036BF565E
MERIPYDKALSAAATCIAAEPGVPEDTVTADSSLRVLLDTRQYFRVLTHLGHDLDVDLRYQGHELPETVDDLAQRIVRETAR